MFLTTLLFFFSAMMSPSSAASLVVEDKDDLVVSAVGRRFSLLHTILSSRNRAQVVEANEKKYVERFVAAEPLASHV